MAAVTNSSISSAEPSQRELRRGIFAMIWPVATENVLLMLIGFVNTAMVGRLGAATILAVGLSGRVGMFVWIILGAVGTGATVLIARALGAGDQEQVRRIAQQALLVAMILMLLISGTAYVFAPSLLAMFKATPDSLPIGVAYLRILAFSMPFQALYLVISAILRGTGNTRVPMQIALVINLVNVALNSVLIFGRLGFPALGFRGPAVASIVGQMAGVSIAAWYLFSTRSGVGIRLRDRVSLDVPLVRRLLGIGIPSSAEMFFWQIAAIIIFRLINDFGTIAGAAHQLGLQAEGISYMPSAGFGIAATALVGRSLGARNPHLAERYIREIVRWGIALSACATALLVFAPRLLMGILTNDKAVIALGAQYLMLMGFSQIPQQISMTLGGSLRGAGDTVTAMVAAAVGIWGFRVPFAFILSRSFGLGIHGVWWAINIDQWVRVVIVGWRYLSGKWKTAVGDGLAGAKSA
ncbi:MAG: MATE family efflux transporter [Bacillota bacterium]